MFQVPVNAPSPLGSPPLRVQALVERPLGTLLAFFATRPPRLSLPPDYLPSQEGTWCTPFLPRWQGLPLSSRLQFSPSVLNVSERESASAAFCCVLNLLSLSEDVLTRFPYIPFWFPALNPFFLGVPRLLPDNPPFQSGFLFPSRLLVFPRCLPTILLAGCRGSPFPTYSPFGNPFIQFFWGRLLSPPGREVQGFLLLFQTPPRNRSPPTPFPFLFPSPTAFSQLLPGFVRLFVSTLLLR